MRERCWLCRQPGSVDSTCADCGTPACSANHQAADSSQSTTAPPTLPANQQTNTKRLLFSHWIKNEFHMSSLNLLRTRLFNYKIYWLKSCLRWRTNHLDPAFTSGGILLFFGIDSLLYCKMCTIVQYMNIKISICYKSCMHIAQCTAFYIFCIVH